MTAFVGVAWLEQLAPGHAMTVTVGDAKFALFNVDGTVHAIDDACLHEGSSLGAGVLDGKIVRCPRHSWRYDVTNGQLIGVPGLGVSPRAVKVVDGRIMVEVD